jgi:hypothetical protein
MKRTKSSVIEDVDLIIAADLHIREDCPVCRVDSFFDAQAKKIKFIKDLQIKWKCPILVAGDIFHMWKPSPFLLAWSIEHLPDEMIVIPGQHDLPNHNIDLINKSGIFVLERAGKVKLLLDGDSVDINGTTLYAYPFGSTPRKDVSGIALWHHLVWQGERPWPTCTDPNADDVLDEYSNFSMICTGDNHKSFVARQGKRVLVNAGSLTRQTADQVDHRPRVYLWSAATNHVTLVYIPIQDNVISREHIDKINERDDRIEAFVRSLSDEAGCDVNFEQNLEIFLKTNNIRTSVKQIIYKAMEQE